MMKVELGAEWQDEKLAGDFPGEAVDKNLSTKAEGTGLIPGPGRFHMLWGNQARVPLLLSLSATTTEAHAARAWALNKRSSRSERLKRCNHE